MSKLTQEKANEIGGALQRIQELSGKKIIETSDAAEKRGLQAFVDREASEHLPELLGCWVAMQNNYVPLVRGFAALLGSASAMLAQSQPAAPAEQPAAK